MRNTASFSFSSLLALLTLLMPWHAENHFNWQTLEADMLKVHWYEGDAAFGQAVLETAQTGFESTGQFVPSHPSQPVEIFIYASVDDLQSELIPGGENWMAGHADPALGVVRVVVEPGLGQGIIMEQRIPHELMHLVLYRQVGKGYNNLPVWLREGMATMAEVYPNAEYERVLKGAAENHTLIPLTELCSSFPSDAGQAFLAYAEARSFTGYLHETYGSAGLMDLAAVYADGVDCERGPERVFSVSLARLEALWRSSLSGQNTFGPALQNILPYLILLFLVLVIPLVGILTTFRKGKSS